MTKINFNITVIRHAQTTYGEQNQFMGTLDIPCSEKGKYEARMASNKFIGTKYSRIYCSPLSRAIQTTECLFPEKEYIIENNLRERGLGSWAGKNFTTIKKIFPEAFLTSGKIDPYYTPRDGETIENVISRVKSFLDTMLVLFDSLKTENNEMIEYDIAVVTHNGIIRVMKYLLDNTSLSEIFSDTEKYLSPTKYSFDGKKWKRTFS